MMDPFKRLKFAGPKPFKLEVSTSTLNGSFPIHAHEYTEISIVVSGTGTHIVCGREYLIAPGDVFVVNPDATHGFSQAKELFHYKLNYLREMLEAMGGGLRQLPGYQALFVLAASGRDGRLPCRLKLPFPALQWTITHLKRLKAELAGRKPGCETLAQAYFMEFIVEMSRRYGAKLESFPEQGKIDRLVSLAAYLENHFLEPIDCEAMARIAQLSERQFRRVFEEYYQMSPINYLEHLRLEHASALLASTDKTISEIAFACGFGDCSYFCKRFRKNTGMSPKEYREQKVT